MRQSDPWIMIRSAVASVLRGPYGRVAAGLIAGLVPSAARAFGPVDVSQIPAHAVVVSPGMSLQSVVDANRPGTTYFLTAGLYRTQQVVPKNGDRFIGAQGAQMNGARLLVGAKRLGDGFVFENQAPHPEATRHGVCEPEYPRCDRPQALFLDNKPLRAVARPGDVAPGKWYFDYEAGRIHLADDPTGKIAEITYTPFAFGGTARNVTIENLIVEKYASGNQRGAINDQGRGTYWTISRNEVRQNYGYGITLSEGHRATGNKVHGNGQLGIGGGTSANILVEGNEIAFNAWNGTRCDWECGGAKWGLVSNIVIRGNYVHNNGGVGLWTDERCRDVLMEGNRVENNARAGISHEISFNAVIRRNVLRGNGASTFGWGWQAQIQIQNSLDTEVYENQLELHPTLGGNGITVIQQDRGVGFAVRNVHIHDNMIVMRGGSGVMMGWFADFEANRFPEGGNRFEANRYHAPRDPRRLAWFTNNPATFAAWQKAGADLRGQLSTDLPAVTP